MAGPKRLAHDKYTIGWICALPLEMAAAKAMLDEIHEGLPQHGRDSNTYTLGAIGGHNVVIACLPFGVYGTTSAGIVASQMLFTYTSIRFGLMVGIAGGVPMPNNATTVRLGDVVVGKPMGNFGGVVQFDLGKMLPNGRFERMGMLNKPPPVLLTALSSLEADNLLGTLRVPAILADMRKQHPDMSLKYAYPGQQQDILFPASYEHVGSKSDCDDCNKTLLMGRPERLKNDPFIHYGLIASSNQVMRDGYARDRLAKELDILCFEMEAAGLMDNFPCLVIRGICDYADSHKNKDWQEYAAAAAAAYAKCLISVTSVVQTAKTQTALKATSAPDHLVLGSQEITKHDIDLAPILPPVEVRPVKVEYSSANQTLPTTSMNMVEKLLEKYFVPARATYNDQEFASISKLLGLSTHSKYSKIPRLYTLLRHLGRVADLDHFLKKGFSDHSLPFSQTQLPAAFKEGWKTRFMAAQGLVCDGSDMVQMMRLGKHMTFSQSPTAESFISTRIIATGERSQVDEILCILGEVNNYARKQFYRSIMTSADSQTVAAFKNEVEIMKRIVHHHCVKLIASYTDPQVFALVMSPVAESNLGQYLQQAASSSEKRCFLAKSVGCLSRTLWFMHKERLRHRDIKPENILIHNGKVLFTDFDCSYSWTHTNRSTTTKAPPRTWKYASPEVAQSGLQETSSINSSSDIWSLGCVYLEIITVLKGKSVNDLNDHLRNDHYYANISGIDSWIKELEEIEPDRPINLVLEWVKGMLRKNSNERLTAHELVENANSAPNPSEFCCPECLAEGNQRVQKPISKLSENENVNKPSDEIKIEEIQAPVANSETAPKKFSLSIYAAEVCEIMGKTQNSLKWDELAVLTASYSVYKKGMTAAGYMEDSE